MIRDTRRKLLKGLAVTLPAAWTRPVVDSIMLPAHAQTSPPETEPGCGAEAGCYVITNIEFSFSWPGGVGPETVDVVDGIDCDNGTAGTRTIVVAEDEQAAAAALQCSSVNQIVTDPTPTGGCRFFECDIN